MDEDRLRHSIAVARKMVEIAKSKNLSDEDIKSRYGEDSEVYNKCCKIVDKIRQYYLDTLLNTLRESI